MYLLLACVLCVRYTQQTS